MLKVGLSAETGEVAPDGTVVAKPARPVPRLEEIAPHFPQLEILECLGHGGMGAVYKARQPKLDRLVALKILTRGHDPKVSDTEFAARFQQEARALARISHPDIVAVYDFGEAGGYHYLLMEYVDGLTLRQLLQTHKLSPEQALAIVPKICEALQFAHERGIVHRDIKPENILLDKQGEVKIADFGIAKILGPEATGAGLTGAKDVIGTPHYMAPEQVEKPQTVDHRADIYSLGVVFYEMLTGELPLGKFPPPSRMVQVDVRLDEVVLHALEKSPERRYQHASEVKTDVEKISATPAIGSSGRESAPSDQSRLTSAATRETAEVVAAPNRWMAYLSLALFLCGLLGTILLIPIIAQDEWALIFGGTTLGLALVFGALSWKERMSKAAVMGAILTFIGVGITVVVLVWTPPWTRQEIERRQQELLLRTAAEVARVEAAAKVPPVVIATVPESGAANVVPSLTELRVTFSKPMQDGSWSWTIWGEENFPEMTGQPHFLADKRTCVLPVKLKPGKLYASWLNSDYHKDFKDTNGQPALPYLLIFETKK